jgi:hypothetical protein
MIHSTGCGLSFFCHESLAAGCMIRAAYCVNISPSHPRSLHQMAPFITNGTLHNEWHPEANNCLSIRMAPCITNGTRKRTIPFGTCLCLISHVHVTYCRKDSTGGRSNKMLKVIPLRPREDTTTGIHVRNPCSEFLGTRFRFLTPIFKQSPKPGRTMANGFTS